MGAWGFDALDSDGALDWIDSLRAGRVLAKEIKKAFTSRRPDYDAIRAAAVMIERGYKAGLLNESDVADLIPLGIEALDELSDSAFVDSYDEPAAVKKSIRKQVEGLVVFYEELPEE